MIRRINALLLTALLLVTMACDGDDPTPSTPRTVLVYMVASNSLGDNGSDRYDLQEMEKAIVAENTENCNILVYHKAADNTTPILKQLYIETGHRAAWKTLATYEDLPARVSVSEARMRQVIADMQRYAPAPDYGLILWSHATGWAPSLTTKNEVRRRSFGDDNGYTMPLNVLSDALPDNLFSFICADVCYFGSVEVAYQLRDKCRFFMASASEVPTGGMPYDVTLPYLCRNTAAVDDACEATFKFYNNYTGAARSYTGVVVDCNKLDALADACRNIYRQRKPDPANLDDLQYYNINKSHFYFDLKQYYNAISPNTALTTAFNNALNQAVVYAAATPAIFSHLTIDPNHYCGLSTYIDNTSPGINQQYYETLEWYNFVIK